MQLHVSEIAPIIGAIPVTPACDTLVKHLLTDSRDLTYPGSTLFFALRTAVNNGHRYIADLYTAGVRCFVADEDVDTSMMPDATLLRVPSVIDALQTLAAYVRSLFPHVPVIGITGSRGKTVVKEQVYTMLEDRFGNIVRSPRSYNSQIGVPLSVWQMDSFTRAAVFEAGISQAGEMERLQKIIRPVIGVFTSLTTEHAEGFSSLEQKAAEKAVLFKDCPVVYAASDCYHVLKEILDRTNPECAVECIGGGNKALSDALVAFVSTLLSADRQEKPEPTLEKAETSFTSGSNRIRVTDTLKNCLIVTDPFTNDLRSLSDGLDLARRHLTPGRSLTLILPRVNFNAPAADIMETIEAKGVKRLISIGDDRLVSEKVVVEHASDIDDFVGRYTISDFRNELILVKGTVAEGSDEISALLEAPRHETVMEVDLGAVVENFNFFRSRLKPGTGIVAMVKADGYGVGALQLAKTLQNQGAAYLAVAVIDEGVYLRRNGITMPIMVMNPIGTNYKALFENSLEPSVFSMRELQMLHRHAQRLGVKDYPVHIKLDTGMHRLGFLPDEIDELAAYLNSQVELKVASVFSHLATADCLDQDAYTESQLQAFADMNTRLLQQLSYPVKRHILNTAGILRYPEHQYDMARLGIGLYGVAPVEGFNLKPVARLLTTIISIREWEPGTTIGYGRRGTVDKPATIATIPIGYADGLDRHLSRGAASFLVNGRMCPVVGNICMDQCMIDVTGANARIGDMVEIFGADAPLTRLSDTLDTIPYEILTSVSPRVKRIYFRE